MTVSMRVMSAGDGYKYLLRTVAAADGDRTLSTPLTRYYVEAGTPPGQWLGSGVASLGKGQLAVGDRVAYGLVGPFFNIEVLRGKIVSRKGVPYVALDQAHNGKKSVRWHKGWTAEILPLGNPR